ncbi:MAG: hypothetical protein FJX47_05230, partial [Alphaproteobacteria bacterium]|nr:hypothetical protein [Alphaproteobacteria bacterium]
MNGRENTILLAASLAAALALGVLALALGQDANWDLRNYHLYNPYAWLEGRRGFDLLPAGRPSFYNPFLHLPLWLLTEALSAKGVAFVLGAAQGGLAFALIAAIAQRLLTEGPWRLPLALACAATASLGGGAVGLLGTSFMDNVLGLFALGAVLILMGEVG